MKIVLDDAGLHLRFAPLTLSRPVGDLRMGIMTNTERWKLLLPDSEIYYQTEPYLQQKFASTSNPDWIINGAIIPTKELIETIKLINSDEILMYQSTWICKKSTEAKKQVSYTKNLVVLEQLWDLFQQNGTVLEADFELLSEKRKSESISSSNTILGDANQIFIEYGAIVEAAIINCKNGPVYIGKDAEIMEGAIIRGPFALCEHAGVKMGAKIYGPTTIGPHCKVGGEISNVIFQSYSNKGHDGFLGNSVIGEWCNLGADSNSSNLKNNYSKIIAYSYEAADFVATGLQFMGLIMGDHSKSGINTMFNTATIVGMSCNIYGADFPKKFIPSFSWGSAQGFERFQLEKAIEAAKAMMDRRKVSFTDGDRAIFEHIFALH